MVVPAPAHKPVLALHMPLPSNPAPHAQTHPTQYQTEMLLAAAVAVRAEPLSIVDVEAVEVGEPVAAVVMGAFPDAAVGRSDLRSSLGRADLAVGAGQDSGFS